MQISSVKILFASETSWRRLQDLSSRCLQDMSSRYVFKTSWRRLQCNNFSSSKTSWRCLEDVLQEVFKTSSKRLGRRKIATLKTCWRRLQNMFWRRLQDQQMFARYTFNFIPNKHFLFSKTSSRRLEDVFRVTLFVFQDVLKTSSRHVCDTSS